jgi:hypothetical protein
MDLVRRISLLLAVAVRYAVDDILVLVLSTTTRGGAIGLRPRIGPVVPRALTA